MSTNFPVSLDDGTSLPNPSANSAPNSPSHSSLHSNANDSIKAVEAKVGTGASTPTSNTFLVGNGTGTSAWSGLTSAQLAARLSDETGSGAAVFASSPTLTTPQVDTINESTPANGVTVDGLNIKDGKLNTNSSVVTSNITDGAVTGSKIATSAITLGYAQITTTFDSSSTSDVQVTGLSASVTIPSGGRRVEIIVFARDCYSDASAQVRVSIWDGTVGSGTKLSEQAGNNTSAFPLSVFAVLTPAAGSKTYNVGFRTSASVGHMEAASTYPAFILVKAI